MIGRQLGFFSPSLEKRWIIQVAAECRDPTDLPLHADPPTSSILRKITVQDLTQSLNHWI